uniref:Putative salivary lipocalin n=1 Tax=Panstrongylus lignarius TaxID=156445 RepID=A0A224XKM0_9HEMI
MRIIIVLAVVGVLSDAQQVNDTRKVTQSGKINNCAKVEVQPNFDPERYFKGTWYLTYAQHAPNYGICRTVRTILHPNGTLNHTGYVYRPKRPKNQFYKVRCFGNETIEKGRSSLTCNVQEHANKKKPLQIQEVVMETDYDHYSISYRCVWRSKFKKENIWIYNRKKNDKSEDPVIAKSLKKKGLLLDKFTSRRKFDCVPHPEE